MTTAASFVGQALSRPSMISSALGMVAGKASAMVLGFTFWLLAARIATPEAVGIAAGATSSVMLVVLLASSGLGAAIVLRLPRMGDRSDELVNTAMTLTAIVSVALGLGALASAAVFLDELDAVAANVWFATAFVVAALLGSWIFVADQVSMAHRRGHDVFVRNMANGIASLIALALAVTVISDAAQVLFGAWVVGSATAVVFGYHQISRTGSLGAPRIRGSWVAGRSLLGAGASNQLLATAERAPGLMLPIIVAEILSPEDTAFWYTAWMMAWGLAAVPLSVANALFAEVSRDATDSLRLVRKSIRSSLMIVVPLVVVVVVAAPWLMAIVGDAYASSGTGPLRLLALGSVSATFVFCYFAVARASGRITEAIVTAAAGGVLGLLAAAVAGSRAGLTAMAAAWIGVQAVMGVWSLWRTMFIVKTGPASTHAEAQSGSVLS